MGIMVYIPYCGQCRIYIIYRTFDKVRSDCWTRPEALQGKRNTASVHRATWHVTVSALRQSAPFLSAAWDGVHNGYKVPCGVQFERSPSSTRIMKAPGARNIALLILTPKHLGWAIRPHVPKLTPADLN